MTSKLDNTSSEKLEIVPRRLRPGIKMLLLSSFVVAVSLALFCYALDLKLDAETWSLSADGGQRAVKRVPLAIAMIGFGVSVLAFWSGYLSLSRR